VLNIGRLAEQFWSAYAIGPDGSFYVVSQGTPGVVRYSPTGSLLSIFDPGNGADLDSPQDLAFGPDRSLYVVSAANDRIAGAGNRSTCARPSRARWRASRRATDREWRRENGWFR
jgi:hypothetical protein